MLVNRTKRTNPFNILSGCTKLLYEDVDRIIAEREDAEAKAEAAQTIEMRSALAQTAVHEDRPPPWRGHSNRNLATLVCQMADRSKTTCYVKKRHHEAE